MKNKTQPMGCPCCESESELTLCISGYRIICGSCEISTPFLSSEDEAIEVWNTRPNHNKIFRTFPV